MSNSIELLNNIGKEIQEKDLKIKEQEIMIKELNKTIENMNMPMDEKIKKANSNIISLISELVAVKKNEDQGNCPHRECIRNNSKDKTCDECHEEYYYDYEEKLVEENYID